MIVIVPHLVGTSWHGDHCRQQRLRGAWPWCWPGCRRRRRSAPLENVGHGRAERRFGGCKSQSECSPVMSRGFRTGSNRGGGGGGGIGGQFRRRLTNLSAARPGGDAGANYARIGFETPLVIEAAIAVVRLLSQHIAPRPYIARELASQPAVIAVPRAGRQAGKIM